MIREGILQKQHLIWKLKEVLKLIRREGQIFQKEDTACVRSTVPAQSQHKVKAKCVLKFNRITAAQVSITTTPTTIINTTTIFVYLPCARSMVSTWNTCHLLNRLTWKAMYSLSITLYFITSLPKNITKRKVRVQTSVFNSNNNKRLVCNMLSRILKVSYDNKSIQFNE